MLTVLDVETKTAFDNLKRKKPEDLGVSFTGVMTLEAGKKKYLGFWEDELSLLWPLLEQSDLVVGFNLFDFDYPALSPYYSGDLASLPTLDILKEFEKTAGHRISLNSIEAVLMNLKNTA